MNSIFRGSLILVVAGVLGKVLGAIYRIPLSNVLGADGIGIYQMVFSVFSVALILCSGGISSTVAHGVAKIRAGQPGSEKAVFLKGIFFSLSLSVLLALFFFFFAEKIAILQGVQEAKLALQMAGVALIFASLLAPFRGLYQGNQNMTPTAVSQILEQGIKLVFGLGFALIFSKISPPFAVFGAFLGLAISEIVAFVVLAFSAKNFQFVGSGQVGGFWKTNFSITFSSLIIPLVGLFDSFVVVNLLSNFLPLQEATALFGLQSGIISSLINFPVVISTSVSLVLLPKLSYYLAQNDTLSASQIFSRVFEAMLFVLVPCALVLLIFGGEVLQILYPTLDQSLLLVARKLLQISAIQIVLISFLQVAISVFQSLGKAQIPIFVLALAGGIKACLTVALVSMPQVGVLGLAISNVVFYGISSVFLLALCQKFVTLRVAQKHILFLMGSAAAMSITFFAIHVYFESVVSKIFLGGIAGLALFVLPVYFFDFFGIKTWFKTVLKQKQVK